MDILPIAWAGYCLSNCGTTYSGTCYHVIWDGTGAEDYGADWIRTGFGFEAEYAAFAGTNGLDATNMPAGQFIYFDRILEPVEINDYDLLTFWINLQSVSTVADVNVRLYLETSSEVYSLKLSNYVNMSRLDVWQKAFIDLTDFNFEDLPVRYVGIMSLEATGNIGFYLDDVNFSVGSVSTVVVPIQDTEISSNLTDPSGMVSETYEPSVTQEFIEEKPVIGTTQNMKPSLTSTLDKFPTPKLS